MKKIMQWMTAVILLCCSFAFSACVDNGDNPVTKPMLTGKITSYNKYGAAMLDITETDMTNAGFTLGDVIFITIEGKEIVMPYYDGYYNANGEYVCVAYPGNPCILFTANSVGLPQGLRELEGHTVTIRMKEKGGSFDVQQAMGMKFTLDRNDYPDLSDAEFANARVVSAGNIAKGMLYRSSSPFSNEINRAYYVSAYLESEGVKTALDLSDDEEDMLSYDMPLYSRTLWEEGNVILCLLRADPTADDFNNRLIAALVELPKHPAPYLVHCKEGKDRTGYVCALLEGLCGATYEEMAADYLTTYKNFFHVTPETAPDVCNTLLSLRLNPCLMHYAGVSDETQLSDVDYARAFSDYLLTHGMNQQQLDDLIQALTKPSPDFQNMQ